MIFLGSKERNSFKPNIQLQLNQILMDKIIYLWFRLDFSLVFYKTLTRTSGQHLVNGQVLGTISETNMCSGNFNTCHKSMAQGLMCHGRELHQRLPIYIQETLCITVPGWETELSPPYSQQRGGINITKQREEKKIKLSLFSKETTGREEGSGV